MTLQHCSGLGSGGGFERLHFLLEKAWDGNDISLTFMKVLSPTTSPTSLRQHATPSVAYGSIFFMSCGPEPAL